MRGSISSKQLGYEDLLAPLIAEACIDVVPNNPVNFNVDNVRIVKIMGGALPGVSRVIRFDDSFSVTHDLQSPSCKQRRK